MDCQKIAASGSSLQHLFENSLPEKPATLLESLSKWNQLTAVKPADQPAFIEIFGELHFKPGSSDQSFSPSLSSFPMTSLSSSSSSSSSLLDLIKDSKRNPSLGLFAAGTPKITNDGFSENSVNGSKYSSGHRNSDSFSPMNSESLQLCTEGLGFESSDDVEDLKNERTEDWQNQQEKVSSVTNSKHPPTPESLCGEFRRSRSCRGDFPPPISCIGKSGKPWVCFKSYRQDGRFVLKEVRMPSQEFLHACREDGRLKLQFVQPNDDIQELEEEESEEDDEEEEEEYGSVHDEGEEETEADTGTYQAENDLQLKGLRV